MSEPREGAMPAIVVGVDGSENGRRALEWALAESRVRGCECRVVHAWADRTSPNPFGEPHTRQSEREARAALDEALALAGASGATVEGELVVGHAADVLVRASSDAQLLVVGSRGRSALTGALLGSVSITCARHARCPIVVVPHQR